MKKRCKFIELVAVVTVGGIMSLTMGCGGGSSTPASTSETRGVTALGTLEVNSGGTTKQTAVTAPVGSTLTLAGGTVLTDTNKLPIPAGTITTTVTLSTSASDLPAAAVTPVVPDVTTFLDIDLGPSKHINPPMAANMAVPDVAAGSLVDMYSFDSSTLTWTLEQADAPVASDGTVSVNIGHLSIWAAAKKGTLAIKGNPRTTVLVGNLYDFKPHVIASKTQSLTFSIINKPTWASFSTSTGELTGTPAAGDVGTTTGIVISVTDGTLTASLPPFNITVFPKPPTGSGGIGGP